MKTSLKKLIIISLSCAGLLTGCQMEPQGDILTPTQPDLGLVLPETLKLRPAILWITNTLTALSELSEGYTSEMPNTIELGGANFAAGVSAKSIPDGTTMENRATWAWQECGKALVNNELKDLSAAEIAVTILGRPLTPEALEKLEAIEADVDETDSIKTQQIRCTGLLLSPQAQFRG